MILGSFWDGFRTKCWSFLDFVFTCLGHVCDMFGHTFGTPLKHCFEQIEISKSDETLPDHFSIKQKASREVLRQIRRVFCSSGFFGKVLLNYVRQPYLGLLSAPRPHRRATKPYRRAGPRPALGRSAPKPATIPNAAGV